MRNTTLVCQQYVVRGVEITLSYFFSLLLLAAAAAFWGVFEKSILKGFSLEVAGKLGKENQEGIKSERAHLKKFVTPIGRGGNNEPC